MNIQDHCSDFLTGANRSLFTGDSEIKDFLQDISDHIDFAFQPIVTINTGKCYGYEALLRGHEKLGFESIRAVFDYAYDKRILHCIDTFLRAAAIEKFSLLEDGGGALLFYNLDNRILDSDDYQPGNTVQLLSSHGLTPRSVCFEISEADDVSRNDQTMRTLENYRNQSFTLAIDDFGTGYSGLQLLYQCQPNYLKIDRFFISGITEDGKKRLFVSRLVELAHVLSIVVVAEGVETEKEFYTCKDIGCDLVQGYFVSKPMIDIDALSSSYEKVKILSSKDRRARKANSQLLREGWEHIAPLRLDAPMSSLFNAFLVNKSLSFLPVIDHAGNPVGIVRDKDIKNYAYSPFGKDLIRNAAYKKSLSDFITKCPIADIRMTTEKILELFALYGNPEGIFITDDFKYVAFLQAGALLRMVNEKNLTQARDQNPLTKLPGNNAINGYVTDAVDNMLSAWTFVYFDFNDFKPFNDTYGFRQGDRAILLFAELMRKSLGAEDIFLGHVGGDDYFAAFRDMESDAVRAMIESLLKHFSDDAASFYDAAARKKGCIVAKDRHGKHRRFPLLTCSAVILDLPAGYTRCSSDDVLGLIAGMKKEAKASPDFICHASLAGTKAPLAPSAVVAQPKPALAMASPQLGKRPAPLKKPPGDTTIIHSNAS